MPACVILLFAAVTVGRMMHVWQAVQVGRNGAAELRSADGAALRPAGLDSGELAELRQLQAAQLQSWLLESSGAATDLEVHTAAVHTAAAGITPSSSECSGGQWFPEFDLAESKMSHKNTLVHARACSHVRVG